MSERAGFLVELAMFWLECAKAGSAEVWRQRCRELYTELIGAGC